MGNSIIPLSQENSSHIATKTAHQIILLHDPEYQTPLMMQSAHKLISPCKPSPPEIHQQQEDSASHT